MEAFLGLSHPLLVAIPNDLWFANSVYVPPGNISVFFLLASSSSTLRMLLLSWSSVRSTLFICVGFFHTCCMSKCQTILLWRGWPWISTSSPGLSYVSGWPFHRGHTSFLNKQKCFLKSRTAILLSVLITFLRILRFTISYSQGCHWLSHSWSVLSLACHFEDCVKSSPYFSLWKHLSRLIK